MKTRQRRSFSAEMKARIALEAIKGRRLSRQSRLITEIGRSDMDAYERLRPRTAIEACECSKVESVLLVDLLTDNPLHCGFCRREVDPERLQLTAEESDQVAHWFSAASALYRLWLDSGEYEDYAKARLIDPKGQVNTRGLELAKMLSVKIPTKYWFFSDADDGEPTHCPICRSKLDTNVKRGTGCCEACRVQI